jgi:hypothetical protein
MAGGRKAMVTIGTDGVIDYVQMPDGQKFALGPVSVLRLITGVSESIRIAKRSLDSFLANNQVMMSVDLDRLWSLLPFQRARFSSANPLIRGSDHSPPSTENPMIKSASYDTFSAHVELAEDIVAKVAATDEVIDQLVAAGKRFNASAAKQDLHKIASRVAEIAQNVDLAQPWVGNDLSALNEQADKIQSLFPMSVK